MVRASPTPSAVGGSCRAACGGGASVRRAGPAPSCWTGEIGAGAGEPEAVVDAIGERERPAEIGARLLRELDRRHAGRRDGKDDDGRLFAAAQDRRLPCAVDRPAPLGCVLRRRRFALLLRRADRAFDPGFHEARLAANDKGRILRNGQRLRLRRLEVDDHGRTRCVRRGIDPGVDAAGRRGGDRRIAAPVEGVGEAAVHFGTRRHRGREGHQRDAEAERVGVALGHARGGRRDPDRLNRAFKPLAMGLPQGAGAGIAVVVGEGVGERGRRTVGRSRVAVEARQNVARRRPSQPHERRKGGEGGEREDGDAGDAGHPRRELPHAEP